MAWGGLHVIAWSEDTLLQEEEEEKQGPHQIHVSCESRSTKSRVRDLAMALSKNSWPKHLK